MSQALHDTRGERTRSPDDLLAAVPAATPAGAGRLLNRELSWLDFNARVLALAEDPRQPLLERVKYLAIVSTNLDEFFQVRVAGLNAQVDAGVTLPAIDGRTPREQLAEIRVKVLEHLRAQESVLGKELIPKLAEQRIRVVDWSQLDEIDRSRLARLFEDEILPVLTPQSVDRAHPFPYISNLSLNLAVVVRDAATGENRFARVKVPRLLPRFFALPDGERFLPVEQLIAAHLESLFPGMEIVSHHPFRLTLDAELAVDEDGARDLLAAIQSGLNRRLRLNDAIRLEIDKSMSTKVRDLLVSELELTPEYVYVTESLLDLGGLWELYALARPDLKDEPWQPQTPPRLVVESRPADVFRVISEADVLVHHPYDSFRGSVEAFLTQAANDPDVLAIKHTLYRTSGRDNPIVRALTRAAQAGKEVVALIELKARFDEGSNIEWARRLEQAGVHVVYGIVGLKTHAKIALVVRREGSRIRRYCHIGTGNYNPTTADTYEDVGLLSARPELGQDLTEVFNYLTGCGRPQGYRKLLVAPATMRPRLLEEIRRETESRDGQIAIKVNNLSDEVVIDALYAASNAGVEIDLVVRGICCLRPGVPGMSERIRVRSILGRFLEHSRVYRFGTPGRNARYFLGSADLMNRNLERRVETLVQIDDPALQARLEEILAVNLAPNPLAWSLGADGAWTRSTADGPGSQERFLRLARDRNQAGST
ncbi:MAG TPA: polyphosphate kinase 1 [Myxococcota bacterium]|nr:polyphosphate kinase 1 [Myxococcota bacterium]